MKYRVYAIPGSGYFTGMRALYRFTMYNHYYYGVINFKKRYQAVK
jgi:hypothetical protein